MIPCDRGLVPTRKREGIKSVSKTHKMRVSCMVPVTFMMHTIFDEPVTRDRVRGVAQLDCEVLEPYWVKGVYM